MIGNDLAAGVRLHFSKPLFIGLFDALLEIVIPLGEVSGIVGPHFGQFVLDSFGDAQTVLRIEPIVRVAQRMDVPFGAGDDARGNFENPCEAGSVEVARCSDLNSRIGGLAYQRRKPADFQLESDNDEQIGVPKF